MISQDILPAAHLREYIYRYRLRHFYFNGMLPTPKPFPPRPEHALVFYPRGTERIEFSSTGEVVQSRRCLLIGQVTQRVNRYITSDEFLMISVEFRPGALYRLTGIPLSAFAETILDAAMLLDHDIADVNSRLSGARTYREMIFIIELYLSGLVAQSSISTTRIEQALHSFLKAGEFPAVDKLSKDAFMCTRHLERLSQERLGISPKLFLKISRFHHAYQMRLSFPQLNWLHIAHACGYTDYQHLSKDFKLYAQNTPILFVKEEFRSPGRLLGLTR